MSSYLEIDLLNKPFILELTRKVSLSKTISSSDKSRLKEKIKNKKFIKNLKTHFNKGVFTSDDIDNVLKYLEGAN